MKWCQVALIGAFVLLLQYGGSHARSCNRRNTVVQLRIPPRTNIKVKYPNEVSPVKFVPIPYRSGKSPGECFMCSGSRCNKCIAKGQSPLPRPIGGGTPVRTNIIINLSRNQPGQTQKDNTNTRGNTMPSTSTKDGTIVVVQDSTSAFGSSGSKASSTSKNGGHQTSAASASSAAASNTELIGAFTQDANGNSGNSEDIFVEDNSRSTAQTSAESDIKSTGSKPAPNPTPKPASKPPPKPETKPEPKPAPKPQTNPEPKPETKPETKPEPKPEPKPVAKPAPRPETPSEPQPEFKPEPRPEAKPDSRKSVTAEAVNNGQAIVNVNISNNPNE